MCLVITESRTDFTFQLQHLIANYIDLVHKILILREFMDLMLLFSCGWELKYICIKLLNVRSMCPAVCACISWSRNYTELFEKTIHTIIGLHC